MENTDLSKAVTAVLIKVGVSCRHNGFDSIRKAVMMVVDGSHTFANVYKKVAEREQRVESAVRASVRNAVRRSVESKQFRYFDELFGGQVWEKGYQVSMTEFMSTLVAYFQYLWDGRIRH